MDGNGDKILFCKPSYIVLPFYSSVAAQIREYREIFDIERSHMEVEISLSGSCGLGFIAPEETLEHVKECMDRLAAEVCVFYGRLKSLHHFGNSGIFYYDVFDPEIFCGLNAKLSQSGIKFLPARYEYVPHCTVVLKNSEDEVNSRLLESLPVPSGEFELDKISLYLIDPESKIPQLLHQSYLKQLLE